MLGHLKAEEFLNLMEGIELTAKRRAHLESCARCSATRRSMESVRAGMTALNTDISEPDWNHFRNCVRDKLLSRSVQRASAVRRWTGWPIRPAVAWGLSLLIAVGVTTGGFLWHIERTQVPLTVPERITPAVVETNVEFNAIEAEFEVWSQTGMFEELVQLEGQQQDELRRMITIAQEGTAKRE